jgi:hypothetical protein
MLTFRGLASWSGCCCQRDFQCLISGGREVRCCTYREEGELKELLELEIRNRVRVALTATLLHV